MEAENDNFQTNAPSRFLELQTDSFLLKNTGQSFTILITFAILHLFFKLFTLNWNKILILKNCMKRATSKFNYMIYLEVLWMIYLNVTISMFLQFYDFDFIGKTSMAIPNILFFIISMLITFIYPIIVYKIIVKNEKNLENKEFNHKYDSLYGGLRLNDR